MTTPPHECPTSTTGPGWLSMTFSVAATSSASDVKGFGTDTTRRFLACKMGITFSQLDPSAKSPCTSTTVGPSRVPGSARANVIAATDDTVASNSPNNERRIFIEMSLRMVVNGYQ